MKLITVAAAISIVALMSYESSAQEAGKPSVGERGLAARRQNQGAAGRPGRGIIADRDPSQIVARMMTEFDKDGDKKLDSTELTALFHLLRERRVASETGSGGQSQRRLGQRPRARAADAGRPGGTRPKRPAEE